MKVVTPLDSCAFTTSTATVPQEPLTLEKIKEAIALLQPLGPEPFREFMLKQGFAPEDAAEWIEFEDYKVQQGSERWRDNFNPTEFWHHYEIVTGKVVGEGKKQSMYCCTR